MLQHSNRETPQRVAFLLLPKFSLMCLLSAVEPLRGANRTLGYTAYTWHFLSVDGREVPSSNGIPIAAAHGIEEVDDFPAVCVVASYEPLAAVDRRVVRWLGRLYGRGRDLGALETGAFVLAEAGLLAGRCVTVHWETLEAFRETYLDVEARDSLFEVDGRFFTCSGAAAAMDMMLHLIGRHHSPELAASVSEQFLHGEIRDPGARQRLAADRRLGVSDPVLVRVTETMQANLEAPLGVAELAARCDLSRRQLERLFARRLGEPPQRYYLRMRLERARHLLRYGDLPVSEVGLASGFGSAAWFSRAYRAQFGYTPTAERRG